MFILWSILIFFNILSLPLFFCLSPIAKSNVINKNKQNKNNWEKSCKICTMIRQIKLWWYLWLFYFFYYFWQICRRCSTYTIFCKVNWSGDLITRRFLLIFFSTFFSPLRKMNIEHSTYLIAVWKCVDFKNSSWLQRSSRLM